MKYLKNLSISEIFKIVSFAFISILLVLISYLVLKENKNQFLFKFTIDYETKLVDESFYKLYIASKIPDYSFKRGNQYFIKCDTYEICEKKQHDLHKDIEELNISLWGITKEFFDKKIKEISIKLAEVDVAFLLQGLVVEKKKGGAQSLDVFLDFYNYILNLEYLRAQNEPNIVYISSEIIDNTWNSFFTKFYNVVILNLIVSLSLFIFLYSFSNKRKK